MRVRMAGVQRQRAFIAGAGLVHPSQALERAGAIGVSLGIVRPALERTLVAADRLAPFGQFEEHATAIQMRLGEVPANRERPHQDLEGRDVLACAENGERKLVQCLGGRGRDDNGADQGCRDARSLLRHARSACAHAFGLYRAGPANNRNGYPFIGSGTKVRTGVTPLQLSAGLSTFRPSTRVASPGGRPSMPTTTVSAKWLVSLPASFLPARPA